MELIDEHKIHNFSRLQIHAWWNNLKDNAQIFIIRQDIFAFRLMPEVKTNFLKSFDLAFLAGVTSFPFDILIILFNA